MFLNATMFYVSNLTVGAGLVYWAWWLADRYRLDFLDPLRRFQIAWVAFGFLFFAGQYALHQVPGLSGRERHVIYQMAGLVPLPAWSLFMYMLLVSFSRLIGWARPRGFDQGFWALQLALFVATLVTVTVVSPRASDETGLLFGRLLDWAYYLQLLALPLILIVGGRACVNRERRMLARKLGIASLAGFLVPSGLVLSELAFAGGPERFLVIQGLVFLGAGVPPLAVTHRFLARHRLSRPVVSSDSVVSAALDALDLNRREKEIAALVAKGLSNDEIAGELFISVRTVKNNVSAIYKKTKLRNRVELTNYLHER